MKVFHTSPLRIEHPDTLHARKALDFGPGFYVTPLREQAVKYGARFQMRNIPAILNCYELDDNWREGFRVKTFSAYDEEWLDFVVANRSLLPVEPWDAVEGGVANDKIFRTIDLYIAQLISKQEALSQLRYSRPNYQICFLNQHIIDRSLTFVEAITL